MSKLCSSNRASIRASFASIILVTSALVAQARADIEGWMVLPVLIAARGIDGSFRYECCSLRAKDKVERDIRELCK